MSVRTLPRWPQWRRVNGILNIAICRNQCIITYLKKISVSSQHLLSLINDVLDMSRIENGKVTLETKPVHLPELVEDIGNIIQVGADKKRIFEQFAKERTSTVSKMQGTGLGLAITKSLVDMMGGRITVESEPGGGSEFTISLRFPLWP